MRAEASTGELLERIDRKTLIVDPLHPVEDLAAIRRGLPPEISLDLRDDGRLAVGYPKGRAAMAPILSVLSETGVGVRDLTTEEPDLEDVFLELTGAETGEEAP